MLTVLKTSFPKSAPIIVLYRNYKKFNSNFFKSDLKKQLEYTESYESFENVLLNVLQRPVKAKVIRANHAPYLNRNFRKAIMKRSEFE